VRLYSNGLLHPAFVFCEGRNSLGPCAEGVKIKAGSLQGFPAAFNGKKSQRRAVLVPKGWRIMRPSLALLSIRASGARPQLSRR
jgi:hypothetical protein